MANIYDQNVKLQAIADAITNQSITITTGQDLLDALADIANAMQPAAANISYDNTNSGLQAVNVQQAVDENANNISTLNSRIDTKVGDWVSINSATVGNAVTVDISAYKEILFVFNPTAPSRAYMTTGVVPTAFLQINDTFAYGCGGTLNSTTPYGIRCTVQYIAQNKFSFLHAFYDNANITSAVMYVYAR